MQKIQFFFLRGRSRTLSHLTCAMYLQSMLNVHMVHEWPIGTFNISIFVVVVAYYTWEHWVLYKFWSSLVAHACHTMSRSPVSLIGIDSFSFFIFLLLFQSIDRTLYLFWINCFDWMLELIEPRRRRAHYIWNTVYQCDNIVKSKMLKTKRSDEKREKKEIINIYK